MLPCIFISHANSHSITCNSYYLLWRFPRCNEDPVYRNPCGFRIANNNGSTLIVIIAGPYVDNAPSSPWFPSLLLFLQYWSNQPLTLSPLFSISVTGDVLHDRTSPPQKQAKHVHADFVGLGPILSVMIDIPFQFTLKKL